MFLFSLLFVTTLTVVPSITYVAINFLMNSTLDANETDTVHISASQSSASATFQQPEVQWHRRNWYSGKTACRERERASLHVRETCLRISQIQRQPGKRATADTRTVIVIDCWTVRKRNRKREWRFCRRRGVRTYVSWNRSWLTSSSRCARCIKRFVVARIKQREARQPIRR